MTDILIPLGSLTGDPIGSKRYMKIKDGDNCTAVTDEVLILADGREYKNPFCKGFGES